MDGLDPYSVLGVSRTASNAEIKRAYREKVRKAHPDVGGSDLEFKRLTAARDLLLDSAARRRFDERDEGPYRSSERSASGSDAPGDSFDGSASSGSSGGRGSRFSYAPPRRTSQWFSQTGSARPSKRAPYSLTFATPDRLDRRAWISVFCSAAVCTVVSVRSNSLGTGLFAPFFAFLVLTALGVFAQQLGVSRLLRDLVMVMVCASLAFSVVSEDQVLFVSLALLLVSHRPKVVAAASAAP